MVNNCLLFIFCNAEICSDVLSHFFSNFLYFCFWYFGVLFSQIMGMGRWRFPLCSVGSGGAFVDAATANRGLSRSNRQSNLSHSSIISVRRLQQQVATGCFTVPAPTFFVNSVIISWQNYIL